LNNEIFYFLPEIDKGIRRHGILVASYEVCWNYKKKCAYKQKKYVQPVIETYQCRNAILMASIYLPKTSIYNFLIVL
jgi:hypothetical protein